MKTVEIKGFLRKNVGKKDSARLRKQGNVPCVLYGGKENVHFYSHENNFTSIVYTPNIYHVHLDLEGKTYKALLKDIQFHPVTDKINHLDFVETADNKEAVVYIPIHLLGDAIGVKNGGRLRQRKRHLKAKGLPIHFPEYLQIDISPLDIGNKIKVSDLSFDDLILVDPPTSLVVQVISSRLAQKGMMLEEETAAAPAEGAAEGAEKEETEAAEEKEK
jgi:large subunit ribosomal protein L25